MLKKKVSLKNICYLTGFILLTFLAVDFIIAALFLLLNIGINSWVIMMSSAITVVAGWYFSVNRNGFSKSEFCIAIAVALFIVLISCNICGSYYDNSYDGNAYHKLAIGNLKNSWNPVFESADEFAARTQLELSENTQAIWIDHYAKGSWIFGASVYAVSNNIEMGKSINIIFVFILFFFLIDYLLSRQLKIWQALLIAIGCSINPIMFVQLMTFYVDGILGNSLLLIILCLIALADKNYTRNQILQYLTLAMAIIICSNIKFTGLVYAGFFCLAFYIGKLIHIYFVQRQKLKSYLIKNTLYYVIVVIIAVGLVGSNSYIKNLIDHNNPFYPLMGDGKVDIISGFQPDEFESMNPYKKFALMLFSYTENTTKEEVRLKIPFSTKPSEFEMRDPDIRRGGWGPYFSAIFIITCIIYVLRLASFWKKDKKCFSIGIQLLIPAFLLIGLADGSWWARYSPYIFAFSGAAMTIIFESANQKKNVLIQVLGMAFSILILYNTWSLHYTYENLERMNVEAKNVIQDMKQADKVYCRLIDTSYGGIVYNLVDSEINYIFADKDYNDKLIIFKLEYEIEGN